MRRTRRGWAAPVGPVPAGNSDNCADRHARHRQDAVRAGGRGRLRDRRGQRDQPDVRPLPALSGHSRTLPSGRVSHSRSGRVSGTGRKRVTSRVPVSRSSNGLNVSPSACRTITWRFRSRSQGRTRAPSNSWPTALSPLPRWRTSSGGVMLSLDLVVTRNSS